MADLLVPDGDTDHPVRPTGARPWDRAAGGPEAAGWPDGDGWEPRSAGAHQYPTRMARRRALALGDVQDGWAPDVVLTPALLVRVGEELQQLFAEDDSGSSADPTADVVVPGTAGVPGGADVGGVEDGGAAEGVQAAEGAQTLAGAGPAVGPTVGPVGASAGAGERRATRRAHRSHPARAERRGLFSGRRSRRGRGQSPDSQPRVEAPRTDIDEDPRSDEAWFADLRALSQAEESARAASPHDVRDRATGAGPQTSGEPVPDAARVVDRAPVTDVEPVADLEPAFDVVLARDVEPVVVTPLPDVEPVTDAGPWSVVQRPTVVASPTAAAAGIRPTLPTSRWSSRRGPRVLAVVVALALAVGGVVTVVQGRRGTGPVAARAGTSGPTQHAITLALASSAGEVTGLSVLAADAHAAQQVLVPSRLLLDVPGAGRIALAGSLVPGPQAPGQALADALDVRIDATWTLDTSALTALVDKVGGIVVNVDADVTQGTKAGSAVLIGAGPNQRLDGEQAARFAQFLAAGEPEASRLARQEQVVRAAVSGLPAGSVAVRGVIAALPGAPSGSDLDRVVAVLGQVREATRSGQLASTVLPVKDIDAGGTVTAYGLDSAAAAQVVASRLGGVRLPVPPGGPVRVLVQNGVGTPGLTDVARTRLLAANLRYVGGGNLPGFGQTTTVVLLRDASAQNRARGLAVATSLGLGESSLRISESAPTVAEVVVILGADFTAD